MHATSRWHFHKKLPKASFIARQNDDTTFTSYITGYRAVLNIHTTVVFPSSPVFVHFLSISTTTPASSITYLSRLFPRSFLSKHQNFKMSHQSRTCFYVLIVNISSLINPRRGISKVNSINNIDSINYISYLYIYIHIKKNMIYMFYSIRIWPTV
jgi:hypothetical protein